MIIKKNDFAPINIGQLATLDKKNTLKTVAKKSKLIKPEETELAKFTRNKDAFFGYGKITLPGQA